jgi:hypothetical protein
MEEMLQEEKNSDKENTVTDTVTWRLRYLEQIKSTGTVDIKYFSH